MRLKITYRPYNSGGPGGQNSNRSLNAIEASVDVPGIGVVRASSSTLKSQHQNKKRARGILLSKVKFKIDERDKGDRSVTAGFGPKGRVRTYAIHRNQVVDDSGFKVAWTGELSGVIEKRAAKMRDD